jgi:hypothetical protein
MSFLTQLRFRPAHANGAAFESQPIPLLDSAGVPRIGYLEMGRQGGGLLHWPGRQGIDRLLIGLTEGELRWDETARGFKWDDSPALPQPARPVRDGTVVGGPARLP